MTPDDEEDEDGDGDVVTLSNTGAICMTVAFIVLIVVSFGSCLYHCENQSDRKLRCIELTRDLNGCSESFQFQGNK